MVDFDPSLELEINIDIIIKQDDSDTYSYLDYPNRITFTVP